MADVTPKIKLYLFLSILVMLLNLSVISVMALQDMSYNKEYFPDENENLPIDYSGSNDTNYIVLITGMTATSFLPFANVVITAIFFNSVFPFNLIISVILGIISSLQLYILIAIVLNMIPFTNV